MDTPCYLVGGERGGGRRLLRNKTNEAVHGEGTPTESHIESGKFTQMFAALNL